MCSICMCSSLLFDLFCLDYSLCRKPGEVYACRSIATVRISLSGISVAKCRLVFDRTADSPVLSAHLMFPLLLFSKVTEASCSVTIWHTFLKQVKLHTRWGHHRRMNPANPFPYCALDGLNTSVSHIIACCIWNRKLSFDSKCMLALNKV